MNRLILLCGLLPVAGCVGRSTGQYIDFPDSSAGSIERARKPEAEEHEPLADWDDGLSLEEALALAPVQNPRFLTVRLELERAQAKRLTAGQWTHNPVLSAEFDRDLPFGKSGDHALQVGLSQEFEIAGQRGHRIAVAEANIEQTEDTIADAERLLRAKVATTFFENLMLDERGLLATKNVEIARTLLSVAEARFESKQVPEVDVNLVRLQYQRTKNESARTYARRRNARKRLAALLGEPERSEYTVVGELEPELQDVDRATVLRIALENRPDLRAARHRKDVAREQIGLERSLAWPNPNIGIRYGLASESLGPLSEQSNSLGVALSIPLPLLNRREGEIAEAYAEYWNVSASYHDLLNQIERNVDLALNRLSLAAETITIYKNDLTQLSQTNLEEFGNAYRAGEVGTLEVLRAQEDYNRITAGFQEALLEYRSATTEVEAVIGGRITE